MSEYRPVRRSPIRLPLGSATSAATHIPSAGLIIEDETMLMKALVRADPEGSAAGALGVAQGKRERRPSGVLVIAAAPGEWLLTSPQDGGEASSGLVPGSDSSAEFVSVVDVTHAYVLIRITGANAARLLEKVCALDFDGRAFPDGSSARTSVARVRAGLVRDDRHDLPSYLLYCDSTLGQYLFDALYDAGAEFRITCVGPAQ